MRIFTTILCALLTGTAFAQSPEAFVQQIRDAAKESCITVTYDFKTTIDGAVIEDSGYVEAQDNSWHLKGETIEMYTNDKGTWILNPDSKEAMVEPAWSYDDLVQFYGSVKTVGADMKIDVKSKVLSEKKPAALFMPPSFDSDWVVTDLR
ncbi:MAG: hypothetical protein J6V17_02510 [Bacteroidales bacterium]|nr:hypothetical protein [Bacteroidales bacterium]